MKETGFDINFDLILIVNFLTILEIFRKIVGMDDTKVPFLKLLS